jgi:hypothetical protein
LSSKLGGGRPPASPAGAGRRRKLFDTAFAFFHLGALIAALAYAIVSLAQGNVPRFGLILILLVIYYFFLLHPAVIKEIRRRKSLNK